VYIFSIIVSIIVIHVLLDELFPQAGRLKPISNIVFLTYLHTTYVSFIPYMLLDELFPQAGRCHMSCHRITSNPHKILSFYLYYHMDGPNTVFLNIFAYLHTTYLHTAAQNTATAMQAKAKPTSPRPPSGHSNHHHGQRSAASGASKGLSPSLKLLSSDQHFDGRDALTKVAVSSKGAVKGALSSKGGMGAASKTKGSKVSSKFIYTCQLHIFKSDTAYNIQHTICTMCLLNPHLFP
jgi:hypothetical protein